MKYKVLFMEGDNFKIDEFSISTEESTTVAQGIGELYRSQGVEVLGVVKVEEMEVLL